MRGLMTLLLLLFCSPVFAGISECFRSSQFQDWRAPDDKTIIIRVNMHDYYRLDLSGRCPLLTAGNVHLITKMHGSDLICSPVDWELSVSDGPPGGISEPCIVGEMTKLTPDQVAAIPPKFKP